MIRTNQAFSVSPVASSASPPTTIGYVRAVDYGIVANHYSPTAVGSVTLHRVGDNIQMEVNLPPAPGPMDTRVFAVILDQARQNVLKLGGQRFLPSGNGYTAAFSVQKSELQALGGGRDLLMLLFSNFNDLKPKYSFHQNEAFDGSGQVTSPFQTIPASTFMP